MASVPVALWNLKVPAGGGKVPGYDDEEGAPLPYRITMAAIDSSTPSTKPSTLKLHKRVVTTVSDDEIEDEDMDDTESTEEEFVICTLEPGKVATNLTRFDSRCINKHWTLQCLKRMKYISPLLGICIAFVAAKANLLVPSI